MENLDALIDRIQFVTLWTRDLEASRKFYIGLLGLELLDEKEGEFFQVSIAGVPFCVDLHPECSGSETNQIGIRVEHLDRVARLFDGMGLRTKKGGQTAESWVSVSDPDGHELIFIGAR